MLASSEIGLPLMSVGMMESDLAVDSVSPDMLLTKDVTCEAERLGVGRFQHLWRGETTGAHL